MKNQQHSITQTDDIGINKEKDNSEMKNLEKELINDSNSGQLSKKVAKGGAIIFIAQLFQRGLTFFLQVLLGRFLGVGAYGLYTIGSTVIDLTARLARLGMGRSLVRFVSLYRVNRENDKVKGALILALSFSTGFALIVSIILFMLAPLISRSVFHNPSLTNIIRSFCLALPFCVLVRVIAAATRGFKKMKHHARIILFRATANIIIVIVSFFFGFRLYGAITAFIIAAFLSALLGYYLLLKEFPQLLSRLKPSFEVKRLFKFSLPLYLAGFSYIVLCRTDIVMLGYFLRSQEVGIYRAAVSFASLVVFSLTALNMSFAPRISELYTSNKLIELGKLYKVITRWIFSLSMIGSLLIILFSKDLLGIFGVEFVAGWIALIALASFQLLSASFGSIEVLLQMSGRQNWVLLNNTCMILLNIALNIWLIPLLGILGAGLATGISLALNKIMAFIEMKIFFKFSPWDIKYLKPIFAGLISVVLFGLLHLFKIVLPLLLGLVLLPAIYFLTIYLLRLDKEDILVLNAVKRRLGR